MQFDLALDELVIIIEAGYSNVLVVTSYYRVFTWGNNLAGQLGDGTNVNRLDPVEITNQFMLNEGEEIVSVSLGRVHSGLLTSEQRVFTWGYNANGPLGDGTNLNSNTPIDITSNFNLNVGETIVNIYLGGFHSSAITSDGRVFTWGYNGYGQLGDGTILHSSLPIDITSQFNLEIGEVVTSLALGYKHSSAITSNGRMFTWGYNQIGQLGDGSTNDSSVPVDITYQFDLVQGESLILSDLGRSSSAAITTNGRVFNWGSNSHGILGDGTQSSSIVPKEPLFVYVEVEQIDIYHYDDSITEFLPILDGYTFNGWHSDAGLTNAYTFTTMPAEDITIYAKWSINQYEITYYDVLEVVVDIQTGSYHTIALTSDGRIFTWGFNNHGQLGNGFTGSSTTPIDITANFNLAIGETIITIGAGGEHSVLLTSLGRVFVWGRNDSGLLGDGTWQDILLPKDITDRITLSVDENIVDIYTAYTHTFVLTSDGNLIAWGGNSNGQLGLGTTSTVLIPTMLSPITLEVGETVESLYMMGYHCMLLTSLGNVYAWGDNDLGQLGDGTTTDQLLPINITTSFALATNEAITYIELGINSSFALTSMNRVFSWGSNLYGQLGDGTTIDKIDPTDITSNFDLNPLETIDKLMAGGNHAIAITSTGRLFIWGSNFFGQLGDGTKINSSIPTINDSIIVPTNDTIVYIEAAKSSNFVITNSGRVFSWGSNIVGELGDGTTITRTESVEITDVLPRILSVLSTETVDYNSVLDYVAVINGYDFLGWTTDCYGMYVFDEDYMPDNDLELYAKKAIAQ